MEGVTTIENTQCIIYIVEVSRVHSSEWKCLESYQI
nr:MAG TPA: hypothetical protein [Caudoviricetes sp.]